MTYDQRKISAKKILVEFLDDYSAPRGLNDGQLANRITHAADAFARRMPTDGNFEEKVHAVLLKIRDTHLSNTWPPQGAFVMAMPQIEFRGVSPKTYEPDHTGHVARMMAQGLPVAESEVWKTHDVSRDVIDRYRSASVQKWADTHGQDAPHFMREKYGASVDLFFREAAE